MKRKDELRIEIFKRSLSDSEREFFGGMQDLEILEFLNKTVIANSLDINTIKNTVFFGFLFIEKMSERERVRKDLEMIEKLSVELTKTEKTLIKFGVIKGFTSFNWRKEMHRYINIPINSDKRSLGGRKIIYSKKFEEIFSFIANLIKKGEKNGRFPRF